MHIAQLSSVCRDTGTEPPRPQVKQSRATADPLKNPQLLIAAACPKQKASRSQSGGLVGWPYRDRTSAIAGYAIAGHCRSPEETSAARSCSLSQTKNPRILIRGFVGGRYWDRTSAIAGYAIAGHCRSPEETSAARSCSLSQTENPRILIRGFVGGRYWDRTSAIAGYAIAGHCRSPTQTSAAESCSLS
jgi:hypothetical protein